MPCNRKDQRAYNRRVRDRAVLALLAEPDDDIVITPALRVFLAAFDRLVLAKRDGRVYEAIEARDAMAGALRAALAERPGAKGRRAA